MELLIFYKLSFIVSLISAPALATIGHHQLSRGKALEIFALSQFALIGNLIAKLFIHTEDSNLFILLASYSTFSVRKYLLGKIKESQSIYGSYMVGSYLFILAVQYLLIGIFPQLDSHMSVGFFGNMVTSTITENYTLIVIFIIFFTLYFLNLKKISKRSLEINIFKNNPNSKFDLFLFSIPLVTALYGLGFLYTLSFILIPNILLGKIFKNQTEAYIKIALITSGSALVGLFLSIAYENISTTSAQVVLLTISSLMLKKIKS